MGRAMNTLTLARAAQRLSDVAHAAVDRPAEYAERLDQAKREVAELIQSPHL
jgi:hypothetical protein